MCCFLKMDCTRLVPGALNSIHARYASGPLNSLEFQWFGECRVMRGLAEIQVAYAELKTTRCNLFCSHLAARYGGLTRFHFCCAHVPGYIFQQCGCHVLPSNNSCFHIFLHARFSTCYIREARVMSKCYFQLVCSCRLHITTCEVGPTRMSSLERRTLQSRWVAHTIPWVEGCVCRLPVASVDSFSVSDFSSPEMLDQDVRRSELSLFL